MSTHLGSSVGQCVGDDNNINLGDTVVYIVVVGMTDSGGHLGPQGTMSLDITSLVISV
jgi:hypothetical protein